MKRLYTLSALAAVLILCGGGVWFLYRSGFFTLTSLEDMQEYIAHFAPYSHLAFFLLQFLSVILAPIPSNVSAAAGGALFGVWPSFWLTFAAVFCGSSLVFWLARVLGRPFADRFVSRHLSVRYQSLLRRKTVPFLTLAFLFPYFPDDALCILAGLTDLTAKRFLLILLLTRPWGLLFASALGGFALTLPLWGLLLLLAGGITLFLLGLIHSDRLEQALMNAMHR